VKSRSARRISVFFRSRRDTTTSNATFLNIPVMAAASRNHIICRYHGKTRARGL
jgi:hypothetical protein